MESDVTQSAFFFKLWAWVDKRRKQILWGFVAVLVVAIVVGFNIWRQGEKQTNANEALSRAIAQGFYTGQPASVDNLLKVTADHPDTSAAGRALLMAGSRLFDDGKYPEARAQFEKYLHDFPGEPFNGQARLGIAASLAASGQTAEAINSYKEISSRYPNDVAGGVAELSLGRLYESQGKLDLARDSYFRIARAEYSMLGSEANARLQELNAQHPELFPTMPEPTPTMPAPAAKAPTNAPAPFLIKP